ncbi:MAG: hypothetical protein ACOY3K_05090 [Candidatus Omnitrophota bacterium]
MAQRFQLLEFHASPVKLIDLVKPLAEKSVGVRPFGLIAPVMSDDFRLEYFFDLGLNDLRQIFGKTDRIGIDIRRYGRAVGRAVIGDQEPEPSLSWKYLERKVPVLRDDLLIDQDQLIRLVNPVRTFFAGHNIGFSDLDVIELLLQFTSLNVQAELVFRKRRHREQRRTLFKARPDLDMNIAVKRGRKIMLLDINAQAELVFRKRRHREQPRTLLQPRPDLDMNIAVKRSSEVMFFDVSAMRFYSLRPRGGRFFFSPHLGPWIESRFLGFPEDPQDRGGQRLLMSLPYGIQPFHILDGVFIPPRRLEKIRDLFLIFELSRHGLALHAQGGCRFRVLIVKMHGPCFALHAIAEIFEVLAEHPEISKDPVEFLQRRRFDQRLRPYADEEGAHAMKISPRHVRGYFITLPPDLLHSRVEL